MLYVFSTPLFSGSWVNRMYGIVSYINGRSRGWGGVVSWKVNLSCIRSSWSRTCKDRDFSECRNCVILWYCPCLLLLCGCIFGCMIFSSLFGRKKINWWGVLTFHYLESPPHVTHPHTSGPRSHDNLQSSPLTHTDCSQSRLQLFTVTWHPFTRRPHVPNVLVSCKTKSLIVW